MAESGHEAQDGIADHLAHIGSLVSIDSEEDLNRVDAELAGWGRRIQAAAGAAPRNQAAEQVPRGSPSAPGVTAAPPAPPAADVYQVVGPRGLTVRCGLELCSNPVAVYQRGATFRCLERRLNEEGKLRLRTDDGWVSECSAVDGSLIAQPLGAQTSSGMYVPINGQEKLGRSCGPPINVTALASARLSEAMQGANRWLPHGGTFRRGAALSSGCSISGSVALRGSIDGDPTAGLQRCLAEVVASAAEGATVTVSRTGAPRQSALRLGFIRNQQPSTVDGQPRLEFDFEVLLQDANDQAPVLELLRFEARCGGARQLLPLLAGSLAVDGHLSLRLDLAKQTTEAES